MSADIKKTFNIDGQYDKKSADFLSNALSNNKDEGFDYIKYRQAVKALVGLDLDEATAFKSAFATAKTLGVTKSGLVSSAKHYSSILMNEKGKFDEALNKRVQDKIASRKDAVLKLEQNIEDMKKKVADIERKIADFQAKIDSADEDVEKEKQKIAATKAKFERAFEAFSTAISADLAKVNEHL